MNLIVVPSHQGHRLTYVRYLAESLEREGRQYLIAASAEAVDSEDWILHLNEDRRKRVTHPVSFSPSDVLELARVSGADEVILPEGDSWLKWLALNSIPPEVETLRLLVMRPDGQHRCPLIASVQTAVKASVRWLVRRRHPRVRVLTLEDSHAQRRGRWGVPDPVVFTASGSALEWATAKIETAPEVTGWAAIVGGINGRKNIDIVADALSRTPDPIGLLIAGKSSVPAPVLNAWIEPVVNAGRPVVVIQDLLRDEELDALILKASCVVLAYSNVGPSGIAGKAMSAGTPVVTAGSRSLRALSRAWPSHVLSTHLRAADLSIAIASAVKTGAAPPAAGARPVDFADRLTRL